MNNITVKKYSKLNDVREYEILEHLNPINLFNSVVFSPNKITYKEVRSVVHLLKTGKDWDSLYEVFNIMYNVSREEFDSTNIVEFYACRNYIFSYINKTQERESKLLQSISADSELWKTAGGERLNKYSNIMPLKQLGEIYSVYPYDLENKPYNQILTLLVCHKDTSSVQQEFSRLKHQVSR